MSTGKEFGYPQGAPWAPFEMRDIQNKCACGAVFVGTCRATCTSCQVQEIVDSVAAMREPMREMGDALAHLDGAATRG